MSENKISSLLELGANRAQAVAALKAAKGDVMTATDRYFSGEYDHLEDAEDDEGKPSVVDNDMQTEVEAIDPTSDCEEESDWNEDVGGDDEYELGMHDENESQQISHDPYGSIFTTKDRVEEVVEVEEEPVNGSVMVEGHLSKEKLPYSILHKGQFLSGCPETGEQGILFQLYHQLSEGEVRCTQKNCPGVIKREQLDFFARFDSFPTYLLHTRNRIRRECPDCSIIYCLACEDPVRPDKGKAVVNEIEASEGPGIPEELAHCPNIQGVLIGVGLDYAQEIYLEKLPAVSEPVKHEIIPGKRKKSADDTSDEESEGGNKKIAIASPGKTKTLSQKKALAASSKATKIGAGAGTGYSGQVVEDRSGEEKAKKLQEQTDDKLRIILKEVREYLPNPFRESGARSSDTMMHSSIFSHLRRKFNQIACSLLQSDSITDIYHREALFTELMEWLQVLSLHDGTASALAMPHMRAASVRTEQRDGREEKVIRYEGMASPRELLERVVIQCTQTLKSLDRVRAVEASLTNEVKPTSTTSNIKAQTVISKAKGTGNVAEDAETAALEGFCNMIIKRASSVDEALKTTKGEAFVARMRQELPALGRAATSGDNVCDVSIGKDSEKKDYLAFVNRTRFDYSALSTVSGSSATWDSCFAGSIASLTGGMVSSKRTLAIAKEMGTMSQNLPAAWESSVFIRVDSSRVDTIKAMITGPEGSPYWNGCYTFDIFLPAEYNQVPPKCNIVSTFGGRHRFGPNLYANGKVCLSLLGTWSGPGWQSGRSTLLQVLISIQALILGTASPIACEPGYESYIGQDPDKHYNANLRRMVVNTAMIEQIVKPCAPFKDVIHEHFRRKAREIREQLIEWESLDDGASLSGDSMSSSRGTSKGTASAEYKKNLERLRGLLDDLESGKEVTET